MDITELLAFTAQQNASDLHLSAGLPPMIRVDGDIRRINVPPMDHAQVQGLIYDIMNDQQRRDYEDQLETDFSFEVPGIARFRVNAFNQNRGAGAVFRTIPSKILTLEELNMPDVLKEFAMMPRGLVLVTGPTGSGKSTTLAGMVDFINEKRFDHILTIEDPIEFLHESKKCLINQREVNRDTKSFSTALRSALREDPDIIMVGEIRDREVAEIAIQAALTGHLVFSTLHTNDAPSAITRLIDMGVKPFLVASSIQAIMAQRLVRVLCKQCKAPMQEHDPKELQLIGIDPDSPEVDQIMGPVGCPKCENIGFKGRRAIFEFMKMNSEVRDLAFQRAPAEEIRAVAIRTGMRTLVDDGRLKILAGSTTPAEVARFAQAEFLTSGNVDI